MARPLGFDNDEIFTQASLRINEASNLFYAQVQIRPANGFIRSINLVDRAAGA